MYGKIDVLVNNAGFVGAKKQCTGIEDQSDIVYHTSVDIAPQRRVDLALRFISEEARRASFGTQKTIEECLADEPILALEGDSRSYAVQKRNEKDCLIIMLNKRRGMLGSEEVSLSFYDHFFPFSFVALLWTIKICLSLARGCRIQFGSLSEFLEIFHRFDPSGSNK